MRSGKIIYQAICHRLFSSRKKLVRCFLFLSLLTMSLLPSVANGQGASDLMRGSDTPVQNVIKGIVNSTSADITDPTLLVILPTGVSFGRVVSIEGASVNLGNIGVDGSSTTRITFSGIWRKNEKLSITFTRIAKCEAAETPIAVDKARLSGTSIDYSSEEYKIANPFVEFVNPVVNMVSIIAGEAYLYEGTLMNTRAGTFTSSFRLLLDHTNFVRPTKMKLSANGREVTIPSEKISNPSGDTTETLLLIDQDLLKALGYADGLYLDNSPIKLNFNIVATEKACSGATSIVVTTTTLCANSSSKNAANRNFKVLTPGVVISSLDVKRQTIDFPDKDNNGTINGDWQWVSPLDGVLPDYGVVKGGDAVQISAKGKVYTSPFMPSIRYIIAELSFGDGKHREFDWAGGLELIATKSGQNAVSTPLVAAVGVTASAVTYKLYVPTSIQLETGDEVELRISATMREDAQTGGVCTLQAELFASAVENVKTPQCRNIEQLNFKRIIIKDELQLNTSVIPVGCGKATSEVIFTSKKDSNLQINEFANELRSNHYVKEVRVYVPASTKIVGVTMLDGLSNMGVTLPSPTSTTYVDGGKTYYDAKMYVFDLTAYYGVYGESAVFKDEQTHQVLMKLDLEFEGINSGSLTTESIKYSVKPANPSTDKVLAEISTSQPIIFPVVKPTVSVLDAQPRFSFSNKKATWKLTISNTSIGAIDLEGLKLELVPQAGGVLSNLSVTYLSPASLSAPVIAGLEASLHKLEAVSGKNVHTIQVEATVSEACDNTMPVQLLLKYDPCATGKPVLLETVNVSCKRDDAELWLSQVGSGATSRSVSICADFELEVKMSVSREPVTEAYIDILLPKNSVGFNAVDFVSVKEAKLNGTYGAEQQVGSTRVQRIGDNTVRYYVERNLIEEASPLNLILKFTPTCNFSNGVKIKARPYAKYFCTTYNAVNSGVEFGISEGLEDPTLKAEFVANITFDPSTALIFDKVNSRKTAVLKLKKSSGGPATSEDKIQLVMPASLRLAALPSSAASEQVVGVGADAKRVIVWEATVLNTVPEGVEKAYSLEFIMDNPATYSDVLNGEIVVSVINKIPAVPCPGGPQPTCSGIELTAGSGSIKYSVVDVFPALAKAVEVKKKSLMDFTFTYTFTIRNLGNLPIRNVQLLDTLETFYSMGLPSNISITTSAPALIANTKYDGKLNTSLLASGSTLQPNETQVVTLSFDMKFSDAWKDRTFVIKNTSVAIGTNENGTEYKDESNSGTDPLIGKGNETVTEPLDTKIPELVFEPVIDSNMPPGFAILPDGVECFEGDSGETELKFIVKLKDGKPLDYPLCFTVFTRDGTATVADADYKAVQPIVMCIEAGKFATQNIIKVYIIGDTKFENNEECYLDIKAGANEIKWMPARIAILNDDAKPNIYIPESGIALIGDEGVANLKMVATVKPHFSKTEGTSTSTMTKFIYRITLNANASQPFTVRVKSGGTNDDATPNADYTPVDKDFEIPTGSNSVDIPVDVVPDNIPENDEVFSLSFRLLAGGVDIQEVTKFTVIRDDDFIQTLSDNLLVAYCLNDDEATQLVKLQNAISKNAPVGYEQRWYVNGVGGTPISIPTVSTLNAASTYTYFLTWYNPQENYEIPGRTLVNLYVQPEPIWTVETQPSNPIRLLTGQSLVLNVTPTDFMSYSFILNGTLEASGNKSSVALYSSKLNPQSNIQVEITDQQGCKWETSLSLSIEVAELPNAFIPGGSDPDNAIFLRGMDISIFNRWGHLLYRGTEGWDGRYKGAFVAPATYYYVVNMPDGNGKFTQVKGAVMVVGASRN